MRHQMSFLAVAALAAVALSAKDAQAQSAPSSTNFFREVTDGLPPADRSDADKLETAMIAALEVSPAKLSEVQAARGLPDSPEIGPAVRRCVRDHAEGIALVHADTRATTAAVERGRDSMQTARDEALRQLDDCRRTGQECDAALTEARARADAREERLAADESGADESPPAPHPVAAARAYAQAHCNAGTQVIWLSDTNFECGNPRFEIVQGKCFLDEDGQTHCASKVVSPAGREEALAPLQIPRAPPQKNFCDGFGGVMICYVATGAVVVGSGLLVADALSDDFNLITVQR